MDLLKNYFLMLTVKVLIVIFIIILALLGVSFFALTKVSDDSASITFNVKAGENKIEIVNNLKSAGLIRSKYVTYVYIFLNPKLNLQAGTYSLSKSMSFFSDSSAISFSSFLESAEWIMIFSFQLASSDSIASSDPSSL